MTAHIDPIPNNTAVRVALWRALHLQIDALPHIIEDRLGLELAAPGANWQQRPDMHPEFTKQARTSIVARARFVEDTVATAITQGIHQYVILGAGLDTFALRRKDLIAKITVYEIDEPATQSWKKQRLAALGIDIPSHLRLVPVDFEKNAGWLSSLIDAGFDKDSPAVVASTGVSMYLTHEAILDMLSQVATLQPHSTFVMSFLVPKEQLPSGDRPLLDIAMKGAAAAGTPFLSFFTPTQIIELAATAGLKNARVVSGDDLTARYFANRSDNLFTSNGEQLLVVTI